MNNSYNHEPRPEGPELHSSAAGGTPDSDAIYPDPSAADTGETPGSPAESWDRPESENESRTGSPGPAPNFEAPDQNDPAADSEETPRSPADTREVSGTEDHTSSKPEEAHAELTLDQSEQSHNPNVDYGIPVPPEMEQAVLQILRSVEDRIAGLAEIITGSVNHSLTERLNSIQTNLDQNLEDIGTVNLEAHEQAITSVILEKLDSEAVKKDQKIRELEEENRKLASDITDYRQGSKGNEVESFIQALFPLYDNLIAVTEKFPQASAGTKDYILKKDTETLVIQLLGIFTTGGVCMYKSDGDEFNSAEQMAIGSLPTLDKEQDRKIATIVKQGFRTDTRILQHELVTVYRFHDDEGQTS